MMTLSIGCKKHPRYIGARRPTGGCEECLGIFQIINELASIARDPEAKGKFIVKLNGELVL